MEIRQIKASETLSLRAQVLRPHHPLIDSQFLGDEAPLAGHFGAFEEGHLVAVSTIYPEKLADSAAMELALKRKSPISFNFSASAESGEVWRLRGMATDPNRRSKGAGSAMLAQCIEHARRNRGRLIWANARAGAMAFYTRNGFSSLGEEYDMPGIGPHYLIYLIL